MMMPAPVAALTTPLYKLATSARLRCRPVGPPSGGAFWLPLLAAALLLLDALPAPQMQEHKTSRAQGLIYVPG